MINVRRWQPPMQHNLPRSVPGFGADVMLDVGLARFVHEDIHDQARNSDRPRPLREAPIPPRRAVPEVLPHDLLLVRREALLDFATGHLVPVLPPHVSLRWHWVNSDTSPVLRRCFPQRQGDFAGSRDSATQRHGACEGGGEEMCKETCGGTA